MRWTGIGATALAVAVLLLGACGGGGDDASHQEAEATPPPAVADSAAADTVAQRPVTPAGGPTLANEGYVRAFPEAGFRIYWPPGCGRLSEQTSSRPTRRAEREFIYNCDRDGAQGYGVSVRVLQNAHDYEGNPPGPRLVTELIEKQLRKSGTQVLRQRPLEADGIQGVEVHSGEVGGPGEVWIRGLLVGTDIFLLMAWDQRGGLFEDVDVVDFFASFRVGGEESAAE